MMVAFGPSVVVPVNVLLPPNTRIELVPLSVRLPVPLMLPLREVGPRW